MTMLKQCTKCEQRKPTSEFKSDRRRLNGVASVCRYCAAEENRTWRIFNPDAEQRRPHRKRIKTAGYCTEHSARWRVMNPERHRENDRVWRNANPEKARAIKTTRLARKRGAVGQHTGEQIKNMLVAQNGNCANCFMSIECGYHVDHMMPLALGGSNAIENIQLLCARCNLTKGAKSPEQWARENKR